MRKALLPPHRLLSPSPLAASRRTPRGILPAETCWTEEEKTAGASPPPPPPVRTTSAETGTLSASLSFSLPLLRCQPSSDGRRLLSALRAVRVGSELGSRKFWTQHVLESSLSRGDQQIRDSLPLSPQVVHSCRPPLEGQKRLNADLLLESPFSVLPDLVASSGPRVGDSLPAFFLHRVLSS
ncbi:hypothetical protein CSUI_002168 [Cystoisospora suis]|uniref:Uncharacterized protein n=1 Tax=Cystoisospora suis TaxID=483139 RepID=A0A2C6L7I4_9APIC|nr:hypothetical protein CSUI_002168 [Cystoisospora suis]